jgi:hypothetical protein
MISRNFKKFTVFVLAFQFSIAAVHAEPPGQTAAKVISVPAIHFEYLKKINLMAHQVLPIDALQFPQNDEAGAARVLIGHIEKFSDDSNYRTGINALYNELKNFYGTGGIVVQNFPNDSGLQRLRDVALASKEELESIHPLILMLTRKIIFDSYLHVSGEVTSFGGLSQGFWLVGGLLTMGAGFAGYKSRKNDHYRDIENVAFASSCVDQILSEGTSSNSDCFRPEISKYIAFIRPMSAAAHFYRLLLNSKSLLQINTFFFVNFEADGKDSAGFKLVGLDRVASLFYERADNDLFGLDSSLRVAMTEMLRLADKNKMSPKEFVRTLSSSGMGSIQNSIGSLGTIDPATGEPRQ